MTSIKIETIKKQDYETILDIYTKAYNAVWESWNKEQIRPFVMFLLKRQMKIKLVVDWKIVWGFISEIKPRFEGNFLFDPELFIDAKYQKSWFWTILFKKALEIAKKKYETKDFVWFTFKDSFQVKWYEKMWINTDSSRQMLYWDIENIIKK